MKTELDFFHLDVIFDASMYQSMKILRNEK